MKKRNSDTNKANVVYNIEDLLKNIPPPSKETNDRIILKMKEILLNPKPLFLVKSKSNDSEQ